MINTFRETVQFQNVSLSPVERRLKRCVTVEDFRRVARRRLPRGVFDYIDGGAEDERTLRGNSASFAQLEWRPRVLRDVSGLDTSTTILGQPLSMPLILAPTGYTRIANSQGELAVARAAERAGVPYALSTMGTRSIEEIASRWNEDPVRVAADYALGRSEFRNALREKLRTLHPDSEVEAECDHLLELLE
jgi:L-lactate dehydrogenase (cytochrome)